MNKNSDRASANGNGNSVRKNLALNMKLARALFGWSQEALSARCGLKRPYLSALERSELNPGIDNVARIARAFGVEAYVMVMKPEEAQQAFFRLRAKATA